MDLLTKICCCVVLAFSINVLQQAGVKKPRELADYKPRSLKVLAETQPSRERIDDNLFIQGDITPSRVSVVYKATAKPLSPNIKAAIKAWANRYAGNPESYTTVYEKEMLFSAEDSDYWLAIKKDVSAELEKKFKNGETLDLLVIKLGDVRSAGKWAPVLLVEKFVSKEN